MKFKNIYEQIQKVAENSLLSLWAPGQSVMRAPLQSMFKREPLLAEPVFQSSFPWEPAEIDSWNGIFDPNVQEQLQIGKVHTPYRHQVNSWRHLVNNESIVVTSGTGSGKTECFMYPILNDIYQATESDSKGIRAIFLYPLNALMHDQRDRLGKLCDKLDLKFGVYNGNTPESEPDPDAVADDAHHESELLTRNDIRNEAPPILLSNPSMLEYILVRDKDQNLIEASSGKLKWIVIDEAHTYTGSAAIELQYQIRRILNAFNVSMDQVNFACTSATIGDSEHDQVLKEFISSLTGKSIDDIFVIGGKRIVPELKDEDVSEKLDKLVSDTNISSSSVMKLRDRINSVDGMNLREIWNLLDSSGHNPYSNSHCLELLDKLCDIIIDDKPLLALRGHFFMRLISGLYACPNHQCSHSGDSPFGYLTSYPTSSCKYCNTPMLELVQCKSCSEFMYLATLQRTPNEREYLLEPFESNSTSYDPFRMEYDDISDDEEDPTLSDFYLLGINPDGAPVLPTLTSSHVATYDSLTLNHFVLNPDSTGRLMSLRGTHSNLCSRCNSVMSYSNIKKFRVPADFLNNVIAPVLLSETAEQPNSWGKYIAFTDSRQGTAISAKKFNIEVERKIAWSKLILYLSNTNAEERVRCEFPNIDFDDPEKRSLLPILIAGLDDKVSMKLSKVADVLFDNQIFSHISSSFDDESKWAYKCALVRNYIARRTLYQNTIENMGLIHLVYPRLKYMHLSDELKVKIQDETGVVLNDIDWQNYLKICLDFFVRERTCIQPFCDKESLYTRDANIGTPIFPSDSKLDKIIKWPSVNLIDHDTKASERQSRLIVLLCAGLNIRTSQSLFEKRNLIEELIQYAWSQLTDQGTGVLKQVERNGLGYNDPVFYKDGRAAQNLQGYYLDLSPKSDNETCRIELLDKAYLCPITHKFLDVLFKGYSPSMTQYIAPGIIDKYYLGEPEPIEMPKISNRREILDWLQNDSRCKNLKKLGLWSTRHDDIYQQNTVPYIAAEHSAQQNNERLKNFVKQFKENQGVNILNCSTTMEMGVDIGDIELVMMTTIPPTSANYMQRAGRAGRNGQTRSIAFSFCNSTMVGMHAFRNPKWAIESSNYMSQVRPSQIIIQRHINSFFFREFLTSRNPDADKITRLSDFFEPITGPSVCDNFIVFLQNHVHDKSLQDKFRAIFMNQNYVIGLTLNKIKTIKENYSRVINDLTSAFKIEHPVEADPLTPRARAIYNQIARIQNEMLLQYLSEQQFIPNASMPTGIIEFDFSDAEVNYRKSALIKNIKSNRALYRDENNPVVKQTLYDQIRADQRKYDKLKRDNIVTRDLKTSLNEYAPGQTVVINENNYISSGVILSGDFDLEASQYFLYHCTNCGNILYTPQILPAGRCNCGSPYRSIISHDANNASFTKIIEPIGYRTDASQQRTKYENTFKEYYEIKPELANVEWTDTIDCHLCQSVSKQDGEILFMNMGKGDGFAICQRCGRAVVDIPNLNVLPSAFGDNGIHNAIWGGRCSANNVNDIWRHVVLSGRLQTTYVALRFFTDTTMTEFVRDEQTVYSLGVLLTRALVQHLGIDENEVDFGLKYTDDSVILFIYDTNKGGCGYSLALNNPDDMSCIFDLAFTLVSGYHCHCEETDGACSSCLVDRRSMHCYDKLSKAKALQWLVLQKGNYIELPETVRAYSPEAKSVYRSFKQIAKDAVSDPNVRAIDFYVETSNGFNTSDFGDTSSEMGEILNALRMNGKKVRIYVEYDENAKLSVLDKYTYSFIPNILCSYEVIPIKPSECFYNGIVLEEEGRILRYFTDLPDTLELSNMWGTKCQRIFVDHISPEVQRTELPTIQSIIDHQDPGYYLYDGTVQGSYYRVTDYFNEGIIPTFKLTEERLDLMKNMLRDQEVSVTVNDTYLNSPLSVILLYQIIADFAQFCSFRIGSVTVKVPYNRNVNFNSKRVQELWDRLGDSVYVHTNFQSPIDCDKFTKTIFSELMGLSINLDARGTDHSRSITFTGENNHKIIFRPDQGVGGGWNNTSLRFSDLNKRTSIDKFIDRMTIKKDCEKQILLYLALDNRE